MRNKFKYIRVFEIVYLVPAMELGKSATITRQIVADNFEDCVSKLEKLVPKCHPKFIKKIEDKGTVIDYEQ